MIDHHRWQVVIAPIFKKRLTKLERTERERILRALTDLGEDPFKMDVKPLKGRPEWRLRIGMWRVILRIDKTNLFIVALTFGSRGDVYKG